MPTVLTLDDLRAFIAASRWIFAKTMPLTPHEYTLRREAPDEAAFERVVVWIREAGTVEEYEGRAYVYVVVDGHKYWTMGAPLSETILINRAVLEPPRC